MTTLYLLIGESGGVMTDVRAFRSEKERKAARPAMEQEYEVDDEYDAGTVIDVEINLTTLETSF